MALSLPLCTDGALTAVGNAIECVGGTWTIYDGSKLPGAFDLAALDPERLGGFFAVGFTLAGTAVLIGISVSLVLNVIKRG